MRGYFGIGIERVSKAMNVGSLFRSAHAFGAGFVFTVAAAYPRPEGGKSDTSDAPGALPFYSFPDVPSMILPEGCSLVGVELLDDAVDLPSFHHPRCAAYVMGPERGRLSPEMTARCDFLIRIPTRFSVNVGIAGALVMYDRVLSLGRFARRPVRPGGPTEPLPEHVYGDPVIRRQAEAFRTAPPLDEIQEE
jgi:tRNA G18 (ribose-2'-O)-methylase SpoU